MTVQYLLDKWKPITACFVAIAIAATAWSQLRERVERIEQAVPVIRQLEGDVREIKTDVKWLVSDRQKHRD